MIRFALLAALPLAACAASAPFGSGAKCHAEHLGGLVGQALTPRLPREAQSRARARSVRVIAPGTAVTMDYRPDRLNIHIDEKNRITRVNCG